MDKAYRWAFLGAGSIANEMAAAFQSAGRVPYSVANRTHETAVKFAARYGIARVYDSIPDLFADPEVDIVYLSTPHSDHIQFILEALRSGKHVLCEKAITLNSAQLTEASALAAERGLVLAEAMTLYHTPLMKELSRRVGSGALGPVRMIQASFGSYKPYDMTNRFFNKDLAGGALLDIGVYALSLARLFLPAQPDRVVSLMNPAPTGADEQAGIVLMAPGGETAVLSLSLHAKQPKRAVISCDKGYIEIYSYPRADEAVILRPADGTREVVKLGDAASALWYEVEDMERAVSGGANEMRLPLTRDVMDLMTRLRADWGLTYPME